VSLIEILVALAVLSVGIYGAAELLVAARNSATLADRKVRASGLAQLKFEELRAAGPALADQWLSAERAADGTVRWPKGGPQATPQDGRFAWRAIVKPAADGPAHLTVEVFEIGRESPLMARVSGWATAGVPKGGGS
jgi:type II secretory pathway pseudopilin PulG